MTNIRLPKTECVVVAQVLRRFTRNSRFTLPDTLCPQTRRNACQLAGIPGWSCDGFAHCFFKDHDVFVGGGVCAAITPELTLGPLSVISALSFPLGDRSLTKWSASKILEVSILFPFNGHFLSRLVIHVDFLIAFLFQ